MKEKSRKQNIMIAIIALLLVVTIGYATLQTSLTINGTSKINNSTWNVHFNNPTVSTGSVAIDTTKYANAQAATKDSATSVSYNVLLSEPGDFYEFTVPVQNEGTIDAMIDTITSTIKIGTGNVTTINSSADLPAWLNYSVTYSDGNTIAAKQKLDAGDTETYKVRVEFKKDITNAQLEDASGKELQLTFSVDYVQKDNTAVAVSHPVTMYGVYPEANKLTLNSAVPANAILHLNAGDALADWTNPSVMNYASQEPYYLKHKIENDIITESYVVFTVTPEIAQANPGMTAGTYELRGGIDEENKSEKTIYDNNNEILRSVFNCTNYSSRCNDYDTYKYYNTTDIRIEISADGEVTGYDGFSRCYVKSDGETFCEHY